MKGIMNFKFWIGHKLKSLNTWKRVCDLRQRGEYEKLLREGIDPIQAKAKIKKNIINYQEELRKEMGQKTEGSGCRRVS